MPPGWSGCRRQPAVRRPNCAGSAPVISARLPTMPVSRIWPNEPTPSGSMMPLMRYCTLACSLRTCSSPDAAESWVTPGACNSTLSSGAFVALRQRSGFSPASSRKARCQPAPTRFGATHQRNHSAARRPALRSAAVAGRRRSAAGAPGAAVARCATPPAFRAALGHRLAAAAQASLLAVSVQGFAPASGRPWPAPARSPAASRSERVLQSAAAACWRFAREQSCSTR